jgi:hypothetical protein
VNDFDIPQNEDVDRWLLGAFRAWLTVDDLDGGLDLDHGFA